MFRIESDRARFREIVRGRVRKDLRRYLSTRSPAEGRPGARECTDPTVAPKTIGETSAQRWVLEVTFHCCKGKLGLEAPQNRTERAVQRIVHDLVEEGYLAVRKEGRRNHYEANLDAHLRHPVERAATIRDLTLLRSLNAR